MSMAQTNEHLDVNPLQTAATLAKLFRERIHCSPGDELAYRQFDAQGAAWQDWNGIATGL